MIEEDLYDHEFVEKYVHGFEEYRAYVKQFTPEYTEKITGVPAEKILEAARCMRQMVRRESCSPRRRSYIISMEYRIIGRFIHL